MLAQIVREVMTSLGMTQPAFAKAIGANIDRVKNMTSGRVSKFHPDEVRMLVEEFGVRGDYLATGVPPLMQRDVKSPHAEQASAPRSIQRDVEALEIPVSYKRPIRDLVAAVQLGDAEMVLSTIDDLIATVESREGAVRIHEPRRSWPKPPKEPKP